MALKVRVFCNAGMSTSMLVTKIKEVAKKRGLELDIVAFPLAEFEDKSKDADVILLGPQVGYAKKDYQGKAGGIPLEVIPMVDYGMMNGEKVLDFALGLKK
ncbi:MAG: PTS sugar transporter subunit IIB [Elusimicrobiota bacterium]|jgi:PTS system cellobiose-specific IIB component|nr:PTS sugar transporter subunit IIB [Elusimicrobiota bacterium]